MEIPVVNNSQSELVQQIKHVQLGSDIFAINDILRITALAPIYNADHIAYAMRCYVYLKSSASAALPIEVKPSLREYAVMQEVMCGSNDE